MNWSSLSVVIQVNEVFTTMFLTFPFAYMLCLFMFA